MTVRAQTFDGPNLQSPRSQLPALHERRDQIIPLFSQFSNAADLDLGSGHQALGAALTQVLLSHSWPGNIRELKSAAKRFVLGFPLLGAGPGEAPESECRGSDSVIHSPHIGNRLSPPCHASALSDGKWRPLMCISNTPLPVIGSPLLGGDRPLRPIPEDNLPTAAQVLRQKFL